MSNKQTHDTVHDGAIESIAAQYHIDEDEIRSIYENELTRLKSHSRIKSFLPVLTSRHVIEILLHTGKLHHV